MTTSRLLASALLASLSALALPAVSYAQAPGIHRTDLQREDLAVPGRGAVRVLVAFGPGGLNDVVGRVFCQKLNEA